MSSAQASMQKERKNIPVKKTKTRPDPCSIKYCSFDGIKLYNLFNDKKGFTISLCHKHSAEVDKSLIEKGLRVKKDGTYEVISKNWKKSQLKFCEPEFSCGICGELFVDDKVVCNICEKTIESEDFYCDKRLDHMCLKCKEVVSK